HEGRAWPHHDQRALEHVVEAEVRTELAVLRECIPRPVGRVTRAGLKGREHHATGRVLDAIEIINLLEVGANPELPLPGRAIGAKAPRVGIPGQPRQQIAGLLPYADVES